MEHEQFTVLENKTIGRNFSMFRKVKDVKAAAVADYVGISETAYTKYERGESKITVDIIQKVAECLKIDPLQLLSVTPSNFLENIHYSPISFNGNSTLHALNDDQTKMMLKLVENVMAMNEKIMALLDKE
jgi:transcriptional regulator with XRE-family HTH domain